MNDYSIGSIEALSWANAILRKCKTAEEFATAQAKVQEMILKLASGTAVTFRDRADLITEL